jgi:SAM-dependent methyltransferase
MFRKILKRAKFVLDIPRLCYLFAYSKIYLLLFRPKNKSFISGIKFPSDFTDLKYEIHSLMNVDLYLRWYMGSNSKRSYWHRAVEYSTLLGFIGDEARYSGLKILDIGTGNSTYPVFFLQRNASVISIDLSQVMGGSNPWTTRKNNKYKLQRQVANMLDMPFDDQTFDIVSSISVIEHLNERFTGEKWIPVNNSDFKERTVTCIREMARVLKTGGIFYVTTDIFEPQNSEFKQLDDPSAVRSRPGYTLAEFKELWLPLLEQENIQLQRVRDFNEENLQKLLSMEPAVDRTHKRPVVFLGIKG